MSFTDDFLEADHGLCDKCGEPVPRENDMAQVMAEVPGMSFVPFIWYSRHFMPVYGESGTVLCEGSPSRAQYIEGQPRDTRGYLYDERFEPILRTAWAALQASVAGE